MIMWNPFMLAIGSFISLLLNVCFHGFMPMTAKITRHFSYHCCRGKLIKDNHVSIYNAFIQGNFSTKRTVEKFNMLPPDQVIEQTINKQQKGSGGIISYSTSIGTIQKWVILSHALAEALENFTDALMQVGCPNRKPKDLVLLENVLIRRKLSAAKIWLVTNQTSH